MCLSSSSRIGRATPLRWISNTVSPTLAAQPVANTFVSLSRADSCTMARNSIPSPRIAHHRSVPSAPAVHSSSPSQPSPCPPPLCAAMRAVSRFATASNTISDPSSPLDAIRRPDGQIATRDGTALCEYSSCSCSSSFQIVPSSEANARNLWSALAVSDTSLPLPVSNARVVVPSTVEHNTRPSQPPAHLRRWSADRPSPSHWIPSAFLSCWCSGASFPDRRDHSHAVPPLQSIPAYSPSGEDQIGRAHVCTPG